MTPYFFKARTSATVVHYIPAAQGQVTDTSGTITFSNRGTALAVTGLELVAFTQNGSEYTLRTFV